jgi:hypothetical protein
VNATVASTDTKDNNPQTAAFVGCVTSGKLTIECSLALGEVKAPASNSLGFVVGYSATSVKVKEVFYANNRIHTAGGTINGPDIEYDSSGDVPTLKTIADLKKGNTLFSNSDAWVYEANKLPSLK